MRYVSLVIVFVNTPFEINCKSTHYSWIGKIYFAVLRKVCIFATRKNNLKLTDYEKRIVYCGLHAGAVV